MDFLTKIKLTPLQYYGFFIFIASLFFIFSRDQFRFVELVVAVAIAFILSTPRIFFKKKNGSSFYLGAIFMVLTNIFFWIAIFDFFTKEGTI